MWIFAYGSLMFDGWEREHACLRKELAALPGHVRSFTKASTRNWGSKLNPAPTLRVVSKEDGVCHGVAFEFGGSHSSAVLKGLEDREGKGFECRDVALKLATGDIVDGKCFFYTGPNILNQTDEQSLARLALRAVGRDGSGIDYVLKTASELSEMRIDDAVVSAMAMAVKRLQEAGA
ncbi:MULTISPECIES: gamma-glutamylcyclotransferase [Agrobacterium tumefaciens complex]|uniref:gamma-glutamylcyclotransferase n=1 Tax=Agrobacterium tumefaciens TaxID=358 RepID=UPI000FE288D4|nr:gamma-glutamylcyclotransferase [Agrobacterium tumefaciens]QAA99769.1 hypothetical protein DC439_18570 [Agrobacterium tumefaciens]